MSSQPEPASPDPTSHLDPLTLAALVDLHLDRAQRAEVEGHLAACALCRSELYGLRRLVRALPVRRPAPLPRVMLGAGVAPTAAALPLLMLRDPSSDRAP